MASSPPRTVPIPHNLFDDAALSVGAPVPSSQPTGISQPGLRPDNPARVYFSRPAFLRPQGVPITRTFTGGTRGTRDEEAYLSPVSERPPIPSALAAGGAQGAYATPLPVLPLVVLSITMLGEFLSANVCTPFLLFMVEGFLVDDKEADVGYWTGILVSTFFLTQFLTSLLWATVADRHGQRTVLFVSLLGSALTCFAFGTSSSLPEALAIRLMQGIFAGSIGVARSSVTGVTDGSNEGRAYAILGFCWGLGGVAGAIIGGSFESPAKKWPRVFAQVPLFVRLPYLLPCAIAASVTFAGAILSLFLARDGGPREGAIRLPTAKDENEQIHEEDGEPPSSSDLILDDNVSAPTNNVVNTLRKKVSKRFSGIFAKRVIDAQAQAVSSTGDHVPLSPTIPLSRRTSRVVSGRTSRANGSAYGYGGRRPRLPSNAVSLRRGSISSTIRRRRGTFGDGGMTEGGGTPHEGSNFAQRLLMANEMAVTNIADLWVAAAINVDNDEVFMSDEDEDYFSDDDLEGENPRFGRELHRTFTASSAASRNPLEIHRIQTADSAVPRNPLEMHRTMTAESATPRNPLEIHRTLTAESATPRNPLELHRTMTAESTASRNPLEMHRTMTIESVASRNAFYPGRRDSPAGRFPSATHSPSPVPGRHISGQYATPTRTRLSALARNARASPVDGSGGAGPQLRTRPSRAFSTSSSQLPSIYTNAGVRAPPALLVDPPVHPQTTGDGEDPFSEGLDTIPERDRLSQGQAEEEKPPSVFRQLPLMIILQYGLLALHSTTHDQIFLSYLVSKYDAGGLGLNAAHFAQLIALMCLAQIAYQFYLYPNIGPPRGRFSHLAMFRLGSLLFIPAYASVTLYHAVASPKEDGNFILMTLLAISTAVRYCGATFSYTAVAILLNYMSPPHVVGLANGLAQSIVSLARFAGPVLGGYLWSVSIQDNPSGYPLGFFICSGVCGLAILHSFVIR